LNEKEFYYFNNEQKKFRRGKAQECSKQFLRLLNFNNLLISFESLGTNSINYSFKNTHQKKKLFAGLFYPKNKKII